MCKRKSNFDEENTHVLEMKEFERYKFDQNQMKRKKVLDNAKPVGKDAAIFNILCKQYFILKCQTFTFKHIGRIQ